MCLYPKLIENKKYKVNKKNKGIVPMVNDTRVLLVPVGCGNCIECRKQKMRMWQVRLLEELRHDSTGKFVTLTFSDIALNELYNSNKIKTGDNKIDENEAATVAVRYFLERWRKETKKSVKHWLITELGHNETKRIHIHGIIFTNDVEMIKKKWEKYGLVYIGDYVNERTINYIVKYVNKVDTVNKGYKPKILCSKGIGSGYLKRIDSKINAYREGETKEYYRTKSGHKINLPIYYRNNLYTDEEREKLWLKKTR